LAWKLAWKLAWELAFGSALEVGIWSLGFDVEIRTTPAR
jgi:hypothetical protein